MNNWQYLLIVIILATSRIIRKNISESNKLKRIDKLKELENNKINAIGNYEKKSSFWNYFKRKDKNL